MKYKYPLKASETTTYTTKIRDYRRLTLADKKILVNQFKEFYKYCFWYQNLPMPTRDQLYMSHHMSKLALSEHRTPSMLQAQRRISEEFDSSVTISMVAA